MLLGQERRKVEEAYVNGLRRLARKEPPDADSELGYAIFSQSQPLKVSQSSNASPASSLRRGKKLLKRRAHSPTRILSSLHASSMM